MCCEAGQGPLWTCTIIIGSFFLARAQPALRSASLLCAYNLRPVIPELQITVPELAKAGTPCLPLHDVWMLCLSLNSKMAATSVRPELLDIELGPFLFTCYLLGYRATAQTRVGLLVLVFHMGPSNRNELTSYGVQMRRTRHHSE